MKARMRFVIALVVALLLALLQPPGRSTTRPVSTDALLAQRIRYVFVIYQENRSFDHYFGTFPGADGIWSTAARTHGFRQYNPLAHRWTTPFRVETPDLGVLQNARDVVEAGIAGGRMNGFVAAEGRFAQQTAQAMKLRVSSASVGDSVMSHVDCDTIPYYWLYADRFALFDRFFQGVRGPSTPSNIEIIAAQNGETELARYGPKGPPYTRTPPNARRGVPVFYDLDPAWGPYNPLAVTKLKQVDQTYANVLLLLEGSQATALRRYTQDVREDIALLRVRGYAPIAWRWYQQGYRNPVDPQHATLVTHHLAPHYFGYVANNPSIDAHVADITQFYRDVAHGRLGVRGAYYLKGGVGSNLGLRPAHAAPRTFLGDDDHPGLSDLQVAEADVASEVNAIARSPYWKQSAIIITWDDGGGFWDHVVPPTWIKCPDGRPCGNGQRVPLILISPFARDHAVVHEPNDQSSVVKFIERVFQRPALASLPDEQKYPHDLPRDGDDLLGELSGGFSRARLLGTAPPVSASEAVIPDSVVRALPSPDGCHSIGVTPLSPPTGVSDKPPPGFDPRGIVIPLNGPIHLGD